MEATKEALQYVADLAVDAQEIRVKEICGKTYAIGGLTRYDKRPKAAAITARSLTSLADYIGDCGTEFPGAMIIHITGPTTVRLMSTLDVEREREVLFEVKAEVSEFQFDKWYDQERMMIELQSSFQKNDDLGILLKATGNIKQKNDQSYSDDGCTQIATMTVGVATQENVIVPNPVELIPYRTFQEVEQPASKFVFRIGDKEVPAFKLVEAENGIWKNEAIANIKSYLVEALSKMPVVSRNKITIIG